MTKNTKLFARQLLTSIFSPYFSGWKFICLDWMCIVQSDLFIPSIHSLSYLNYINFLFPNKYNVLSFTFISLTIVQSIIQNFHLHIVHIDDSNFGFVQRFMYVSTYVFFDDASALHIPHNICASTRKKFKIKKGKTPVKFCIQGIYHYSDMYIRASVIPYAVPICKISRLVECKRELKTRVTSCWVS